MQDIDRSLTPLETLAPLSECMVCSTERSRGWQGCSCIWITASIHLDVVGVLDGNVSSAVGNGPCLNLSDQ